MTTRKEEERNETKIARGWGMRESGERGRREGGGREDWERRNKEVNTHLPLHLRTRHLH